jgi:heat shock protein HslJ
MPGLHAFPDPFRTDPEQTMDRPAARGQARGWRRLAGFSRLAAPAAGGRHALAERVLMRIWTGPGFLALGLALQGCSSAAPVERELTIAPAPVACAGDPPATCLSASEPSGDTWLMRSDEIEGFAYEPGFTYEVLVEDPPLSQEMAVVPRLRLIRVVSKEPSAGAAVQGPLARGEWRLQSITAAGPGAQPQAWPDSEITASFHVGGGWVDGFAGCDRYIGALAVDGEKIKISAPTTTQELCAREAAGRQRTYLQTLAKALSYTVTGDSLELTLLDGGRMQFRAADG